MEILQPGHYWKTPFYWEPGCPQPSLARRLGYHDASDEVLRPLIGRVMATSMDESDKFTLPKIGVEAAVQEVYDLLPQYFEKRCGWWRTAKDTQGRVIGFVLPVTFKEERFWKDEKPQGTILYMGVLPGFRGHRYALELVHEATRVFLEAGCWRVFCDTGSGNTPMVNAFRNAGYVERPAWQRPLA